MTDIKKVIDSGAKNWVSQNGAIERYYFNKYTLAKYLNMNAMDFNFIDNFSRCYYCVNTDRFICQKYTHNAKLNEITNIEWER